MENLKEFKALIKKYESITIEEIYKAKDPNDDMFDRAKKITGFGSFSSCTLCQALGDVVRDGCDGCVWVVKAENTCGQGENVFTYDDIAEAENPAELLAAFKERAKYMKPILKTEL